MLPSKYDYSIYRGDIFTKEFAFYNIDADGVKTPVDLSGSIAKAQCRDAVDYRSKLMFEFTTNIYANKVTISLSPTQTQTLEPGSYVYDLQIDNVTKLYGKIRLIGDVTHD